MEFEFDVTINDKILYDYMMHHTYYSPSGLIGTTVGALMICGFFMGGGTIYLIIGGAIMAYLPWTLMIKAKQQAAANPAFKKPLHYKFTEAGIEVSQNEETQKIEWTQMYKAISTRSSIVVYTSKINAFIFPRKDLGDKMIKAIEMISTHMPPSKVKIKS